MSRPTPKNDGSHQHEVKEGATTRSGSLLATPYPSADEWKLLLKQFSSDAIAHKLLLAHIPFVFRDEPLKYALFRRTIADEFGVEPTNIFIVGTRHGWPEPQRKGDRIGVFY